MTRDDDKPLEIVREWDCVRVLNAPKHTTISLHVLAGANQRHLRILPDATIDMCGQVRYKLGGFDYNRLAFHIERVD